MSRSRTVRRSRRKRERRAPSGMVSAVRSASATPSTSYGIDEQGASLQLGRGPGELGKDEDAVALDVGGAVLLGHQVHAVLQRSDESHVGGPIVRGEPLALQAPMHVPDRRPAPARELAVDLADETVDERLVLLVPRDLLAARNDDLDQGHLALHLGMPAQERAERLELLRHALRVVQPVDPEDELAARLALANLLRELRDLGPPRPPLELGGVHRDREGAHPQLALPEAQCPDGAPTRDFHLGKEQADALDEVPAVPDGLEPDEVEVEERVEHLEAPGQLDEHVQGRKRDVEEERRPEGRLAGRERRGHPHEVVIVDPDEIVGRRDPQDRVGEPLVHGLVRRPVRRVEVGQRNQVVEQRPDDLVREAGVEAVPLRRRERHREKLVAEAMLRVLEQRAGVRELLLGGSRPADPPPSAVAEHGPQRRDQSARAGLDLPLSVLSADRGERKPIGDDDQAHDEDGEQAAFHSPRKARTSPGGWSQATARVGRGSGRTSTGRPRPRSASNASSSVRSSPRYAIAASLPSSANARSTTMPLWNAFGRSSSPPSKGRSSRPWSAAAGAKRRASISLAAVVEAGIRSAPVNREPVELALQQGSGAFAAERAADLVEEARGVPLGSGTGPAALARLTLEAVGAPEVGDVLEPREPREIAHAPPAHDPDRRGIRRERELDERGAHPRIGLGLAPVRCEGRERSVIVDQDRSPAGGRHLREKPCEVGPGSEQPRLMRFGQSNVRRREVKKSPGGKPAGAADAYSVSGSPDWPGLRCEPPGF